MNAGDSDGTEVRMALGTMRGFRSWHPVVSQPYVGALRSITASTLWCLAEPPDAECHRRSLANAQRIAVLPYQHPGVPAPVKKCSCGFYALHSPDWFNESFTHGNGRVYGVVEGFGRIIVGPAGFRAQRIRIVALACNVRSRNAQRARIVSKVRRDDPMLGTSIIEYQVGWPDGSVTFHVQRLYLDRLGDDAHLLDAARLNFPKMARMEATWPFPVREMEERFNLRVYPDVGAMLRDFPPQESNLIPKPKPNPEQQDAANYNATLATGGPIHAGTITVNTWNAHPSWAAPATWVGHNVSWSWPAT